MGITSQSLVFHTMNNSFDLHCVHYWIYDLWRVNGHLVDDIIVKTTISLTPKEEKGQIKEMNYTIWPFIIKFIDITI